MTPPFIPSWTTTPIPHFTLSASGLIVLADLSTIAQRTALRGGSSWLDALLLVPGLHYQQAADELSRGEGAPVLTAVEIDSSSSESANNDKPIAHRIVNQAVVNYVLRTAQEGRTVVLDVGEVPVRSRSWALGGMGRGQRAMLYAGGRSKGGRSESEELSWLAQLLYLASPVLTGVAIAFIVLLKDWWALGLVLALMISRILNIFVIKSRSRPKPQTLPPPFVTQPASLGPRPRITQYTITLTPTTIVILRGLSTDLYALTTTIWLRPKTNVEGYLEAIAKMLVYLVAAISGNATQAGSLVLLGLLLVSGGLLALSNARVKGLRNGGRLVSPSPEEKKYQAGTNRWVEGGSRVGTVYGGGRHATRRNGLASNPRRETTDSWPSTTSDDWSSMFGMEDSLEKGQVGRVTRRTLPSDDSVEYEVQLETRMGTVAVSALRDS